MIEQIKNDMVTAMKEKNTIKRDILRVLRGELQRSFITKDADVVKTVKKMIQNIKENDVDETEIAILEAYLPVQMSNDDMVGHARGFIENKGLNSPKQMGMVMGHFKQTYDGTYDGKVLSGIVKSLLS
tara:strand:+ start:1392 stop:1775 length:384 start_codon:yes stop_codon:yes gene_type:complete